MIFLSIIVGGCYSKGGSRDTYKIHQNTSTNSLHPTPSHGPHGVVDPWCVLKVSTRCIYCNTSMPLAKFLDHGKCQVQRLRRLTQTPLVAVEFTLWWTNITVENHHFSWESPLFLWPFSIAMLVHQRVVCLVLGMCPCWGPTCTRGGVN